MPLVVPPRNWQHTVFDILDGPHTVVPQLLQLPRSILHDVLHRCPRLLHHCQQAIHQPLQRLQHVVNGLRTVGRRQQVPHGCQQVQAAHDRPSRRERVNRRDDGVHEGELGPQVGHGGKQRTQ